MEVGYSSMPLLILSACNIFGHESGYLQHTLHVLLLKIEGGDYMFTFQDEVKFNLYKGKKLKIGSDLKIVESDPPQDFVPYNIKELWDEVLYELAQGREVYLGCRNKKIFLYKRKVLTIISQEIEFLGYNQHKTPILKIDGVQCSGYTAISNHLFGYYHTGIKELVKPYLSKKFELSKLKFLKWNKYHGNIYPVFLYGENKKHIKGYNNLQKMFPQLSVEYFKSLEVEGMVQPRPRHIELIDKFDIEKEGDIYQVYVPGEGKDIAFPSKNKVMEFIREQGETLSKSTANKLFEALEKTP